MQKPSRSSLVERILFRLEHAEWREPNPHLQADYRIAWITVLYASRGEPSPHWWATYKVLRTPPDRVWASIVGERKARLGPLYAAFFPPDAALPPKKPAQSERLPLKRAA